ncbi:PIN domain-containing protein [Patescibacteria group bacterium]|nr:PIN domain-containing protein [Patescibacteria group bacterium]MDE1946452.1 PIN domain-containing protein [Patescibacteria group bacterium]MDE2011059.1 PIN domain-containing protein [Patescibacteria group bacterium]MDE2233538.1 PIN domain-containing protein [Patescibacteria group bacterium]
MADEPTEKWYYDACTLDRDLETLSEIINKHHPKQAYTSHLAIGEAYANCSNKSVERNDPEILSAYVDLISKLRKYLRIVSNDGVEKILEKIKSMRPTLSITDSIHLATAIREQCCVFRTTDHDFNGFSKQDQIDLAHAFGMSRLSINLMDRKSSGLKFKAKKFLAKIKG